MSKYSIYCSTSNSSSSSSCSCNRRTRYYVAQEDDSGPGRRFRSLSVSRTRLPARTHAKWDCCIVVRITYLIFLSLSFKRAHDCYTGLKLYIYLYIRVLYTLWSTYRTFACVEYFHFCENAIERHVVSVQQVYVTKQNEKGLIKSALRKRRDKR